MTVPNLQDVQSIGLIGFGTMGHTWATALLLGDFEVHVYDANKEMVETNIGRVRGYLESLSKKGKWQGDVDATMAKLIPLAEENHLAESGVPIVLEVIFEEMNMKCEMFERLGKMMPEDVIFWTNTSCLDVLKMGKASGRPEKFIGTHGMNPVHLMHGVEIVRHPELDPKVLELTLGLVERLNKKPFVTDNVPGFIVNNGLIPWMIHYAYMLERRQATTADIDTALNSSLGHPQGVFKLTDFIGINTTLLVAEELYAATLDPRYKAPKLLYDMRDAGWDGFKTGRGFYDWTDKREPKEVPFEDLTKPRT